MSVTSKLDTPSTSKSELKTVLSATVNDPATFTVSISVSPSTSNVPSMSVTSKLDTPSTSRSPVTFALRSMFTLSWKSAWPSTSNVPSMSVLSKLDTPSTSRSRSIFTSSWKSAWPSTSNVLFNVVAPSTSKAPSTSAFPSVWVLLWNTAFPSTSKLSFIVVTPSTFNVPSKSVSLFEPTARPFVHHNVWVVILPELEISSVSNSLISPSSAAITSKSPKSPDTVFTASRLRA